MGANYREELVGVFGYPVEENPTVIAAKAAFEDLEIPYRYLTIEVKPKDLKDAMRALTALNMKGIHLTVPHKVEALKYLDYVAEDAKLMGAVNTVYVKDGKLYGENTDGKGFIQSLEDEQISIKNKKAVVLGAGGAARAITVELANAGLREMIIVNRTLQRGRELADLINSSTGAKAAFVKWDQTYIVPQDADIVVNTTNIGLYPDTNRPDIDYDSLHADMVVCDIVPNPPTTLFLMEAKARNIKTLDGLGMLVNQGAKSFKMWCGCECNAAVMREAMRKEFAEENK